MLDETGITSNETEVQEEKECAFCDKGLALFGIALGLVLLYISADILMGSRLTSALAGGMRNDD